MSTALLVRFRPAGPWRLGPDNGAREGTARVLHSDTLYSALTFAMRDLGYLDDWLQATAEASEASIRLSSCFPYSGRTLFVQPPRSLWPPANSGKLHLRAVRFVPVSLIPALLAGREVNEQQWAVDPVSECLLPVVKSALVPPPFRITQRLSTPVDRTSGRSAAAARTACLQFPPGAGMWFFADLGEQASDWTERLPAAIRLLADTGVGGGRSRGWGRSFHPEFEIVDMPRFLTGEAGGEGGWWLLSTFSPGPRDQVDWTRGSYGVDLRSGRVDSSAAFGQLKPAFRMVSEGSVLVSNAPLAGMARNVSSGEMPHAVYRSGVAFAVPVPLHESRRRWDEEAEPVALTPEETPVEEPPSIEPPVEEPPAGEPPSIEPPVEEPPEQEPPTEEPPVREPPTDEPAGQVSGLETAFEPESDDGKRNR